jgi:hypothetical protein
MLKGVLAACAIVHAMLCLGGCSSNETLTPPKVTMAPYAAAGSEPVVAVVPLRNESGTSLVDPEDVSDAVVAALQEVRGIRALPLNRTMLAMRALKMTSVDDPAQLRELAREMGVQGVVVGTITAWDPYDPPTLGISLALYDHGLSDDARNGIMLDARRLAAQPTDYTYFSQNLYPDTRPASAVSEHYDAANHQVLMDVQSYATGRHNEHTALGWKRYTASMDLYTKFATSQAVARLMDAEWLRMTRLASERQDSGG